jgi:hypothetical protein
VPSDNRPPHRDTENRYDGDAAYGDIMDSTEEAAWHLRKADEIMNAQPRPEATTPTCPRCGCYLQYRVPGSNFLDCQWCGWEQAAAAPPPAAAGTGMTDLPHELHALAMNMPCRAPERDEREVFEDIAYRFGHRDARHAIAEALVGHEALHKLLADHARLILDLAAAKKTIETFREEYDVKYDEVREYEGVVRRLEQERDKAIVELAAARREGEGLREALHLARTSLCNSLEDGLSLNDFAPSPRAIIDAIDKALARPAPAAGQPEPIAAPTPQTTQETP